MPQYCKTHKANPPHLNCNECFPISESTREKEITDTDRLNWMIGHSQMRIEKGEYMFVEDYKTAMGYATPREAIDAAMSDELKEKRK